MSSTDNIINLRSSDGVSFEVEKAVALQFGFPAEGISLPKVTSRILSKVIEYCKMHVVDADRTSSVAGDDLKAWDAEFIKVDPATLFDLILAANNLNIKGLVDLACRTVADMIKGKTPEEIRKTFGIKQDFTPEE